MHLGRDDKSPVLPIKTRRGRIESILTRIGGDVRSSLMGQAALLRFLGDILHRLDDLSGPEIIHHGTELRRRMELYFKQFLALYGPLALEGHERQALMDRTLGPLTDLVIRVLRRPDPNSAACRGDPRWQEVARQLRLACGQPGWHETLVGTVQRLSRNANVFPHHIVREGHEMTDGQRRQSLRQLAHDAITVVEALRQHDLYPICLRFSNVTPDSLYVVRFEFESDPPDQGREVVAFSSFPPTIPGFGTNFLEALYRQVLLMIPFSNPVRIDPLLAPLVFG
jgi:hypothetical protein